MELLSSAEFTSCLFVCSFISSVGTLGSWDASLESECLGLGTESLVAVPGFLDAAGDDCLDDAADLGDGFIAGASSVFCLTAILFVVAGAGLEVDTEGFAALETGLASAVLGLVSFLAFACLDPSFSSSFLGDGGFLELRVELGLDEPWFSEVVLLLFTSVRAAVGPLAPVLTVVLGLFALLVGLLFLSVSGFCTLLVRAGFVVVALAWGFGLRTAEAAWLLLRGLLMLLSGDALPDVEGVVWPQWAFPGLSEAEP